jgi:phosphoribosylanthranilate isomerase
MSARPHIKICCIKSCEEADAAIAAGASAIGLVAAMPSGPGVIDEETIARIAAHVPPHVATFLLTSETACERIAFQHRRCGTSTVQLCDHLEIAQLTRLREALPGVALVQVVHVTGDSALGFARAAAPHVDALLLDSGRLDRSIRELGGTGRVHDWNLSRRICEESTVPVYLAGGLHAGNIAEALRAVQPRGIDLCSGVRTGDVLDGAKLQRFFAAVDAACARAPAGPGGGA